MDVAALAVFLLVASMFVRSVLVFLGLHKGPILGSFQKYGGEEEFYFPLMHVIIWTSILVLSLLLALAVYLDATNTVLSLAVVIAFFGYHLYGYIKRYAQRHPDIFLHHPYWYRELRDRTTRDERRRVAYMWLRLPVTLRLIYSANDRAFFQWVDLVIVTSAA